MEKLEELWNDNDENGLPFNPNADEALVLQYVKEISSNNLLTLNLCKRVRQWILFNNGLISCEEEDYKNRVKSIHDEVYSIVNTWESNHHFKTTIQHE